MLLIGISAPGNYGPEYKAAFEAIYPDLAMEYGALLYPDFLDAITGDTERALAEWMQARPRSVSTSSHVWGYFLVLEALRDSQTRQPGSAHPVMAPVFGQWAVITSPPGISTSARKRL